MPVQKEETNSKNMQSHHKTESKETYTIRKNSNGYYVDIPEIHLHTANINKKDEVGIETINYNGGICFCLTTNANITQKLQPNNTYARLTIPKKLAESTRLHKKEVRYNSCQSKIVMITNHTSSVTGDIGVYDTYEESIRQWHDGKYAYTFSDEYKEKLSINDNVWFWLDTLGDSYLLVIETRKENAPDEAVELSIHQPETGNKFIILPQKVMDTLDTNTDIVRWGHDDERILGQITETK